MAMTLGIGDAGDFKPQIGRIRSLKVPWNRSTGWFGRKPLSDAVCVMRLPGHTFLMIRG